MQVKKKHHPSGILRTGNPFVASLLIVLTLVPFYLLSRLCLLFFSRSLFGDISFLQMVQLIVGGLRFDVSALLMINLPFLFLFGIPITWHRKLIYRFFYKTLFILGNLMALLVNLADSVYFRFTQKRMTGDFLNYLKAGGQDLMQLLPQYLHDFWYLLVILLACAVFLIIFIVKVKSPLPKTLNYKSITINLFYTLLILGLSVIGIRGGLQLKPIHLVTAGKYAAPDKIPLVLNTPFTMIKTWNQKEIRLVDYYKDEDKLKEIYDPVHRPTAKTWQQKNVVIIILESFSAEYSSYLNPDLEKQGYKGFTPFLDSLMSQSLVFKGYANGKRSIEAIPAVTAAIPSWMNNDYITSSFAGNRINSLAGILGKKGYSTYFFHGGNNGTMNFDDFARMAGFSKYYGRNEYPGGQDYDGKWGIYDEPFFQFFEKKMEASPRPFFSVIFSLSSHHPYQIPDQYKGKFPTGKLPIEQTISYTDYALKRMFQEASGKEWFKNTLFVITADHTSESERDYYHTRAGVYSIPIIFYEVGSGLRGNDNRVVQQVDIMPSVLDHLGYGEPYLSFGGSVFDTRWPRFALTFLNNSYLLIKDSRALVYTEGATTELYDLDRDPLQKINLVNKGDPKEARLVSFLQAVIQQYNTRVIKNLMIPEK